MSGISLDSIREDLHAIAVKDSTNGYELLIDASGHISINDGNNSITVDGTVAATQSGAWSVDLASGAEVQITDGTDTLAIDSSGFITANINGDVNVTQGTSPWVVSATDLDIRDLVYTQDSVTAHQGGAWSFTLDLISSWAVAKESATTTASELVATPLSGRNRIIIQNLGAVDVYLAPTNAVDTDDMYLPKGSSLELACDDTVNFWVITSAGSSDLRVSEFAA